MRGGYYSLSIAYVETTPIPKQLEESDIATFVKTIITKDGNSDVFSASKLLGRSSA